MKTETLFTVFLPDSYVSIEAKRRYRLAAPWGDLWWSYEGKQRLNLGVTEPEVMQRILDDLGAAYHRSVYCYGDSDPGMVSV